MPLDQSACGEPVDPVRHGPRRDQGLLQKPSGGEPVGLTGATQRGEHVELPALEAVAAERLATRTVEVTGQPGDPAEHLQRCDIEVGTLAPPRRDEVVDLVAARRCGRRLASRRGVDPEPAADAVLHALVVLAWLVLTELQYLSASLRLRRSAR